MAADPADINPTATSAPKHAERRIIVSDIFY
jgi:hypothetical protein